MSRCTGSLCSGCLQTKHRCFFCPCLIIIRGAQLSSAPLLTLSSQHYWSVLSRPHRHNHHVRIQVHCLVIRKLSLDLIPEMKAKKNRVTPRWAESKMDFNLPDCCHQGYEKGLCSILQCCFGFVIPVSSCTVFSCMGGEKNSADTTQLSASCSLN